MNLTEPSASRPLKPPVCELPKRPPGPASASAPTPPGVPVSPPFLRDWLGPRSPIVSRPFVGGRRQKKLVLGIWKHNRTLIAPFGNDVSVARLLTNFSERVIGSWAFEAETLRFMRVIRFWLPALGHHRCTRNSNRFRDESSLRSGVPRNRFLRQPETIGSPSSGPRGADR